MPSVQANFEPMDISQESFPVGCIVKIVEEATDKSVWPPREHDIAMTNVPMEDAGLVGSFVSYGAIL